MPGVETLPTVVVGLGGAGSRILDAVADAVERRGGDRLELVALDTSQPDLDRDAPSSARTVALPVETDRFERDRASRPYLAQDSEFPPTGTARSRPLGRYALEANFDRVLGTLEAAVEADAVVPEHPGEPLVLAFAHALGGGTGSGAAPLVAGVLRELAASLDRDCYVVGLGSVPRLDDLRTTHLAPEGRPSYYLNAYAALRESRSLVDPDGTGIDVAVPSERLATDGFDFDRAVVDSYFLVGVGEGTSDRGRRAANRALTDALFALATPDTADGGLPGVPVDGPFVSLAGASVRFPAAAAEQYVEASEVVADAEDRLAELDRLSEATERAVRALGELARGETDVPDVDPAFADACRERARAEFPDDPEAVEAAVESLAGSGDAAFSRSLVDATEADGGTLTRAVASRLYGARVLAEANERLSGHRLERSLAEVRHRLDTEGERGLPGASTPPLEAADRLASLLGRRADDLAARADDVLLGPLSPTASRLRERAEELLALRDQLLDARASYERLEAVRDAAREVADEGRRTLQNAREDAERRLEELDRERERVRREREQARSRRDTLATDLARPLGHGGVTVPVDVEALDAASLEAADSLEALRRRGVVDGDDVVDAVDRAVGRLSDTVGDRREGARTERLVGFHPPEDERFVDGADATDAFDEVHHRVDGTPGLRFVAGYDPLDLEATSEFGTVHELYADAERDVTDRFLLDVPESEAVPRAFAYPELRATDDQ